MWRQRSAIRSSIDHFISTRFPFLLLMQAASRATRPVTKGNFYTRPVVIAAFAALVGTGSLSRSIFSSFFTSRNLATMAQNPFDVEWRTPHGIPPFEEIKPEHYRPAFDKAMAEQRHSLEALKATHRNGKAPTFASFMVPFEKSGESLRKVGQVFFNLASAHTNPDLQKVELHVAPVLARHENAISFDEELFANVKKLYDAQKRISENPRNAEERLIEKAYLSFARRGALLPTGSPARARFGEISERLATLATQFTQNVLREEASYELRISTEEELSGLPTVALQAARATAKEKGLDTDPKTGLPIHVITLSRSSIEPFLTFSNNRALRKQAHLAWSKRGANGNESDTRDIVREMVRLRAEAASLLGYNNYAEYALEDRMAKATSKVEDLLMQCWRPALQKAKVEEQELLKIARQLGHNDVTSIEGYDFRYYAEKYRSVKFALDESTVKPYYQLDRLVDGMFYTASKIYGLAFRETTGQYPRYHPQLRTFDVLDAKSNELVGVFIADFFARSSKRSGAWMSNYREQHSIDGTDIRPIVVNVLNFNAPANPGEPVLLSASDTITLFHEFGHALHGLLSKTKYPSQAGTNVLSDFVELPSQINENWVNQLASLPSNKTFMKHVESGEPIPRALLDKMKEGKQFGEGFATVEYLVSAIIDLEVHKVPFALLESGKADPIAIEEEVLKRLDVSSATPPRHRLTHFLHLFSDGFGMYSSG